MIPRGEAAGGWHSISSASPPAPSSPPGLPGTLPPALVYLFVNFGNSLRCPLLGVDTGEGGSSVTSSQRRRLQCHLSMKARSAQAAPAELGRVTQAGTQDGATTLHRVAENIVKLQSETSRCVERGRTSKKPTQAVTKPNTSTPNLI